MNLVVECVIGGALGGLIKSLLEHKGQIVLPEKVNHAFALGTLVDLIGGACMGWLSANPLVVELFKVSQPNYAIAFVFGFAWMAVLQALIKRLGLDEKARRSEGSGNNPIMLIQVIP